MEEERYLNEMIRGNSSEGRVISRQNLLEEINKSEIPDEIKKEFWHFSSPILSHSFINSKDERDNEELLWVNIGLSLKRRPLSEIKPEDFENLFQVFLHGKTRVAQSRGRRDNLISLLTKTIQVIESREEYAMKKSKFNRWG